jgi:predicted nucleotidyltransferase
MNIDSKTTLAGVPILRVRNFLRATAERGWTCDALNEAFGPEIARELLAVLPADGYVTARDEDGASVYTNTPKAGQLARASAASPISRARAERALTELVQRCEEVRRDPGFLYKVRRALLFGSMLTERTTVSDVDIAIELSPKETDPELHAAKMREQGREAQQAGRRFSSFVEMLSWGETRVRRFLKGRSRIIQLTQIDDAVLEHAETRLIFKDLDDPRAGG